MDLIDETILQLIDDEISLDQLITSKKNMVRKELYFRLAELANAGTTLSEKQRYEGGDMKWYDMIWYDMM